MFLSWKSPGPAQGPSPMPTLEGAIAFWAGKDPLERYNWQDAGLCACGQYAKSIGVKDWNDHNQPDSQLWNRLNQIAKGKLSQMAHRSDWTFGKLTERARSAREALETV